MIVTRLQQLDPDLETLVVAIITSALAEMACSADLLITGIKNIQVTEFLIASCLSRASISKRPFRMRLTNNYQEIRT